MELRPSLRAWDDIAARLRCTSFSYKGYTLVGDDVSTYTEALVLAGVLLEDLSQRYSGFGSHRDAVAWVMFTSTLDVHAVGSLLSELTTLVRNVYEPKSYSWFKRQLSEEYPYIGQFLAPMREAVTIYLSRPTAKTFYPVQQFFVFLSHLTIVDIPDDQEEEYIQYEEHLRRRAEDLELLAELNAIMREWFREYRYDSSYLPFHGSGGTAELSRSKGSLEKYRFLGTDQLLSYVFRKHAGIDISSYYPYDLATWKRVAKVVVVAKSLKGKRVISKEPTTLIWWQGAIAESLKGFVHTHDHLKHHINFSMQELNGAMAIKGSESGLYATMDLSAASDSITVDQVKRVFAGTPVLPYLIALRSRAAELPSRRVLDIRKYAPMGSSLCFPVMTLMLACAIELAVRRARYADQYYGQWRVYGDDIIVEEPLYAAVQDIVERLGFKLNLTKSYCMPTRYRESCGCEGYDGADVTPLRISRGFRIPREGLTSNHAEIHTGLIELANTCQQYGFAQTRARIIRVLLGCPIGPPLFSEDGRGAIASPMPDNFRAQKRFHAAVGNLKQMWEYEAKVCSATSKPAQLILAWEPVLERARLWETLRLTSSRTGDMFLPEHRVEVPFGPSTPELGLTWRLLNR